MRSSQGSEYQLSEEQLKLGKSLLASEGGDAATKMTLNTDPKHLTPEQRALDIDSLGELLKPDPDALKPDDVVLLPAKKKAPAVNDASQETQSKEQEDASEGSVEAPAEEKVPAEEQPSESVLDVSVQKKQLQEKLDMLLLRKKRQDELVAQLEKELESDDVDE